MIVMLLAGVLSLGETGLVQPNTAVDACVAMLPLSLQTAIAGTYRSYRLVQVSDYEPETITSERQYHNGSPCIAVATGDVDGDGILDFAFMLTHRSRQRTVLVSARASGRGGWIFERLDSLGDTLPGSQFVNTIAPGKYTDLYASDRAPSDFIKGPGHAHRYVSHRSGFVTGTIEASAVAYFFTGTQWIHLWLSD